MRVVHVRGNTAFCDKQPYTPGMILFDTEKSRLYFDSDTGRHLINEYTKDELTALINEVVGDNIGDIKNSITTINQAAQTIAQIPQIKATADKNKEDIAKLQAAADQMNTKVQQMNTKVQQIETKQTAQQTTIEKNTTDIAELTTKVAAVKTTADTNKADIAELKQNSGTIDASRIEGTLKADNVSLGDIQVPENNIADDAITSDKIADKAVKSQNIDWGTIDNFTRGSFTRMGIHSETEREITSKAGLQYLLNNGVGRMRTKDGSPTKIRYYKFSSVLHYDGDDSRPTTLPGIGPFDEGGKVWTRVYAGGSQTSGDITTKEFTNNGSPYVDLVKIDKKFATSNNYRELVVTYEAFWLRDGAWKIFGNLSITGANVFLSFETEIQGVRKDYCPSIYFRSLENKNTNNCIFIYEFNDAIE